MLSFAGNALPRRSPDRRAAATQRGEQPAPHSGPIIETAIPARLDALPFGRFHILVIVALGITWILDGLEVTLAGSLSGELKNSSALGLSNSEIGLAGSLYLAGAVSGAFLFGWLTDRMGRKKLFTITLVVYLLATAATGLSWNFWSFALFRIITGAGIGGEYSAINSTIQELIPARLRGWTDLLINGSFWIGAAIGAGGSIVLLDPRFIDPAVGWRLAFLIGAAIGIVIVAMRLWIPESPRWLVTHGFAEMAEKTVHGIETRLGRDVDPRTLQHVRLRARSHTPLSEVARALFVTYRQRTLVGLSLMASQAFFYNAIFFTYALILIDFYHVPADAVGWYILPFAAGNMLGPLLLGRLFDTVGRKVMIASTYAVSGVLLAATAYLFSRNLLSATAVDHSVDDRVLFCFGGGQFGLFDSQRNFSAGIARARHRVLLRHRHRSRWHSGTAGVWDADRCRLARERRYGLLDWRGHDDRRRRGRGVLGRGRRAPAARDREPAPGTRGLNPGAGRAKPSQNSRSDPHDNG